MMRLTVVDTCIAKNNKVKSIDFLGFEKSVFLTKKEVRNLIDFLSKNYEYYALSCDMGTGSKKYFTVSSVSGFKIKTLPTD